MGWQWHQLGHMQIICTSRQTDNHAITASLNFFTGCMLFLTPNQTTEGKCVVYNVYVVLSRSVVLYMHPFSDVSACHSPFPLHVGPRAVSG